MVKRYFRQAKRKTAPSSTKAKSKAPKSSRKKSAKSVAVQDPQDEYGAEEKLLREFDMNMAYGPCIGISRLDRWKRAEAFGLNPPKEVENLLLKSLNDPDAKDTKLKAQQVRQGCLWADFR